MIIGISIIQKANAKQYENINTKMLPNLNDIFKA